MSSTQCPQCQVHLKLPEEKLHSKVKCPKCGGAFLAKPAAAAGHEPTQRQRQRPTKKRASARPFVILVVAGAVTVAAWLMIQGGDDQGGQGAGAGEAAGPATGARPTAAAQVDPFEHPATRAAKQIQDAVRNFNDGQLRGLLDLQVWFERESAEGRLWSSMMAAERAEFGKALAARLIDDPELRRYAGVTLVAASFAGPVSDSADLVLRCSEEPKMMWKFHTALTDGTWRVHSYAFEEEVPAVDDASKADLGGDGRFAETKGGGRQLRGVIERVELVAGTTPEEEKAIRGLLKLARAESGLESRLAKRELAGSGHKAVPILLNELVDLPLNGTEQRAEEIAIIHGLLQDISFRQISFPLRAVDAVHPDLLEQTRQEAVEAWFGWWKLWGKRWDDWIEQSGMPIPEPERAGRTRR
ncbi:MAG: hypothetical protein ISR76_09220 [Planctomycetes bacterium]|nr:hypothetical protein [Planctomycetota bacterium]